MVGKIKEEGLLIKVLLVKQIIKNKKDTFFDQKQIRYNLIRIRVNLIRFENMILARYLCHIYLKIYT